MRHAVPARNRPNTRKVANPEWLTLAEAARILRVHRTTLYRWAAEGRVEFRRFGARSVRLRRADLESIGQQTEEVLGGRGCTAASALAGFRRSRTGTQDHKALMKAVRQDSLPASEPPRI